MEHFKLNNGTEIPAVGAGTFLMSPDDAEASVYNALQADYPLVDTANAYMNERAVGRAIAKSGVARDKIYLSTKLWPSIYGDAAHAIDATLARLGVDYIDLLFLHQPIGEIDNAYRAIEDAVKAGKVRSIGLSNFSFDQIKDMTARMDIAPAVLQTEAHPYYPRAELKKQLAELGIVLMAWYPLGHGDKSLVNEPVFSQLAEKYHKSNAQIILRWHVQMGNVVIPGSRNPEHIKANIDLFDFELTDEDMAQIAKVDKETPYYVATQSQLESYLNLAPDFDSQK